MPSYILYDLRLILSRLLASRAHQFPILNGGGFSPLQFCHSLNFRFYIYIKAPYSVSSPIHEIFKLYSGIVLVWKTVRQSSPRRSSVVIRHLWFESDQSWKTDTLTSTLGNESVLRTPCETRILGHNSLLYSVCDSESVISICCKFSSWRISDCNNYIG